MASSVKVLFFAKSREIVGASEATLELPSSATGQELLQQLCTHYQGLAVIQRNLVLALNEEYVDMESPLALRAGDTLAVIPPLSGG
eukprot:m.238996 g.238996  ORF g.238996 m.238996 type:complete len:86 (+) comp22208_c0_seq1:3-260(+)